MSAVLVGIGSVDAGESTTIYQRAQIENAVGGSVSISAQYEVVLDLPGKDCMNGEFTCLREQRFGQLYRIDFTLNELRQVDGEQQESAPRTAGTIYIAADIERRQELEFEATLEQAIAQLHGDSFRHPHAGWGLGRPPLIQQMLLGPSNRTAWVCMDHEGSKALQRITPLLDGDQRSGVTTANVGEELRDAGCAALQDTGNRDGGRSIATPYDIETLVRTEIDVSADWYAGSGAGSGFQPLPEEMDYRKVEVEHDHSGSSMGYDSGTGGYTMSRTGNGVKVDLKLGEFELSPPAPDSVAWITRWSISTYAQSFGVDANDELLERQQLWVVALPIVDPLAGKDDVVRDPGADRLAGIGGDFDRAAQLDVDLLAEAFHSTVGGALDEGDWLLIYCSPSRAPEYGIAGFFGRSAMENGAQVCEAVTRLYPE